MVLKIRLFVEDTCTKCMSEKLVSTNGILQVYSASRATWLCKESNK